MSSSSLAQDISVAYGGTVSAYRLLYQASDGDVEHLANDTSELYGASLVAGVAGDVQQVARPGDVCWLTAGGALTRGTDVYVTASTDGKAVAWSAGAVRHAMILWDANDNGPAARSSFADTEAFKAILLDNGGDGSRTVSGTATVPLGAAVDTVAVGADLNGAVVVCCPSGGFDATATTFYGAVAAGTLTITANANATADTDVAYVIHKE